MKKIAAMSLLSLASVNAFATNITCAAEGAGLTKGFSLVLDQEEVKKNSEKGSLFQIGDIKFMLSLSDIYSPEGGGAPKIISKDAMVLSQIKDNKNIASIVSDGKNLMLFDLDKNIYVMCRRD